MMLLQAPAATSGEPNFMMWAGASVVIVGVAWAAMRWAGRTVKKDLDPAMSGKMRASMAIQADTVSPALVKEALQKGLVTSQQLATMSPIERQYLFKSLMPKLSGGEAPAAPMLSPKAPVLPLKAPAPAAPANAAQLRSTQAIMAIPGKPMSLPPLSPEQLAALGPPPGVAARTPPSGATVPSAAASPFDGAPSEAELHRVYCPCCGTRLNMPSFAPFVSFCDQCGAKTAVRLEDQGRLIINTAPPGVTRRPVG
jgi:hypothetical protein